MCQRATTSGAMQWSSLVTIQIAGIRFWQTGTVCCIRYRSKRYNERAARLTNRSRHDTPDIRSDFAQKRAPTPEEVRLAIREVVTLMLEPPIANIGVKGIRTAAERVRLWPRTMSDDKLRQACGTVRLYIGAEGGTGGGIFRYMYGRFLKEAAGITGDAQFVAAGLENQVTALLWLSGTET